MRIPGLSRAWRKAAQLRDRFGIHAVILMYHRVTDLPSDPWGLNVTPRYFSEHLEVLRRLDCVVRLEELTGMLRHRGGSRSKAIVVTFDDGYTDNLYEAKPLLVEARLPATIFMTSGDVGRTQEFWWDELERILLQPGELPEDLKLTIDGQEYQWTLGADANYGRDQFELHKHWRADSEERPTARHRLYRSLYDLLQGIAREARTAAMNELRNLSGITASVRPTHRALSPDETRQLSEGDWIEIGGHTVTHQALATQSADIQRDEIANNKSQLENIVGRPVTSFSYPYGLHSDDTVRIVREAGYACSCACLDRSVRQSSDLFRLPRRKVENWSGEEFETRLQAWLNDGSSVHA